MRSEATILIALLSLSLCSGCVRKKGDTGEAGTDDSGDPDTHATFQLADTYDHVYQAHIVPNETGQLFGLSECDAQLTATLSEDPSGTTCPGCDALYGGPVASTYSDCSQMSFSDEPMSYGLAVEGAGFHVWTYDEKGGLWTDEGLTSDVGGGVQELVATELMGDESFSIGEMTVTYTFTAL